MEAMAASIGTKSMSKTFAILLALAMAGCKAPAVTPPDDSWLNGWKDTPSTEPAVAPPVAPPAPAKTLPPVQLPAIPMQRGGEPAPAPPAEEPNAPEWKPGGTFP